MLSNQLLQIISDFLSYDQYIYLQNIFPFGTRHDVIRQKIYNIQNDIQKQFQKSIDTEDIELLNYLIKYQRKIRYFNNIEINNKIYKKISVFDYCLAKDKTKIVKHLIGYGISSSDFCVSIYSCFRFQKLSSLKLLYQIPIFKYTLNTNKNIGQMAFILLIETNRIDILEYLRQINVKFVFKDIDPITLTTMYNNFKFYKFVLSELYIQPKLKEIINSIDLMLADNKFKKYLTHNSDNFLSINN